MLTVEEQALVITARRYAENIASDDVLSLVAVINRITAPRAVLGEAERLLRESKVKHVKLGHGQDALIIQWGTMKDTTRVSLADAYEALKEGE